MHVPMERFSQNQRAEALAELRLELAEFSHDGLIQLSEDLAQHAVLRGSWSGCVISYKRGAPGSCRRDRLGRARNTFTVLWDNGCLTDEDVAQLLHEELDRRPAHRVPVRSCGPRPQPLPDTAFSVIFQPVAGL
jgi:hypothetical protein